MCFTTQQSTVILPSVYDPTCPTTKTPKHCDTPPPSQVLSRDKDDIEAHLSRARLFISINEPGRARASLNTVLDRMPGHPEVRTGGCLGLREWGLGGSSNYRVQGLRQWGFGGSSRLLGSGLNIGVKGFCREGMGYCQIQGEFVCADTCACPGEGGCLPLPLTHNCALQSTLVRMHGDLEVCAGG
jgi:hypothetical protein